MSRKFPFWYTTIQKICLFCLEKVYVSQLSTVRLCDCTADLLFSMACPQETARQSAHR
jgi:hypothetical protein